MSRYRCSERTGETSREEFFRALSDYAGEYLPQWRPDGKDPDIGTVLALIFAGQMERGAQTRSAALKRAAQELLKMKRVEERPPLPARTVLAFAADHMAKDGADIPAGSRFTADAGDEREDVIFRTEHGITANCANLTDVLCVSEKERKVVSWKTASEHGDVSRGCLSHGTIPLFSCEGENIYTEETCICHPELPGGGVAIPRPQGCPELLMERARVRMMGMGLRADMLCDGTAELDGEEAEIFGREIAPYRECYVAQDTVFRKKGAMIECSFCLTWRTRKNGGEQEEEKPELKPVMRRQKEQKKMRKPHVYPQAVDISYYNGRGFRRLELSGGSGDIFTEQGERQDGLETHGGGGRKTLRFRCPADWREQEICGRQCRCIRIRVLDAGDCYTPGSIHHYPVMKELCFSYSYGRAGVPPERIYRRQGARCTELLPPGKDGGRAFFTGFPHRGECMLFGFDNVFPAGYAGIYMELTGDSADLSMSGPGELRISCSTPAGFTTLKTEDGTGGMTGSGIVRFFIPKEASMHEVEGRERFWLRVERPQWTTANAIVNLYLNAAEASNTEISPWKSYVQEEAEPGKTARLAGAHILDARVWVNELGALTEEERRRLLHERPQDVFREWDSQGRESAFFVRWREQEDYVLDRVSRTVVFGDGKHGRIPRETENDAWRIKTVSCQGKRGNVKKGSVGGIADHIPMLRSVYNPVPAAGGRDTQSAEERLAQAATLLSTGGRLVTEGDIIRLAEAFSCDITDATAKADENGCLTVTALTGRREDFPYIKAPLKEYLEKNLPYAGKRKSVALQEAVHAETSVSAWLITREDTPGKVRERVRQSLDAYFDRKRREARIGKETSFPVRKEIGDLLFEAAGSQTQLEYFCVTLSYTKNGIRHTETAGEDVMLKSAVFVPGEHRIYVERQA